MSATWTWEPDHLQQLLEERGYDVNVRDARLAPDGGSLIARRDRGDRAHLIAVDAGGRFRAEVSVALDEVSQDAELAGVALRTVTRTERVTTITATLTAPAQLAPLLDGLDRLANVAAPPSPDAPRSEW